MQCKPIIIRIKRCARMAWTSDEFFGNNWTAHGKMHCADESVVEFMVQQLQLETGLLNIEPTLAVVDVFRGDVVEVLETRPPRNFGHASV
jgi:hypothetical protein